MTDSTAPKLTYRQMCHNGAAILADAGITDAEYDSFALLEYITGMDRTAYILNGSKSVPGDIAERYDAAIDRQTFIAYPAAAYYRAGMVLRTRL